MGKAKSIRKRVASYFQKKDHDPKTQALLSHIHDVTFFATSNEVEALILENNLIKRHQPPYNINLKDAKRYAFLELTNEEFPRLLLSRRKNSKGQFYGPFVSAQERDYVRELLVKTFQLRTCTRLPKKVCLRYHLGLCSGPCAGHISEARYHERVSQAREVLKGKTRGLIQALERDMKHFSEELNFESAKEARDRIRALEALETRQNMERMKRYDEDIINYQVKQDVVYLMLVNVYKGTLATKHEYVFDETPSFFEEFILQYYAGDHAGHPVPGELILPAKIDAPLHAFLEKQHKGRVTLTVPKRGSKKQLLELVAKNIELTYFADVQKLEALQKALQLHEQPAVIECFDISHLSGSSTTGSMVQFRSAQPDKSNYRRFKIKSVEGVDDYQGIAEVVHRRYHRLLEEQSPLPRLIVVDGGKGQLNAALAALDRLELKIPTIALAKQEEEIYLPGQPYPLRLPQKSTALLFLRAIRDEAHRFALGYNRLLRKKKMTE